MKLIKRIGLALAAAAAIMAFVGAGTASATALCKNNTSDPCSAVYASGTLVSGKSTDAKLSTNLGTVECAESLTTVKTGAATAAGTPMSGEVTKLEWKTCHLGSTECTVETVHLNYSASLNWTSGKNGSLTVSSGGAGSPGAHVKCESLLVHLDCTFEKPEVTGSVTGGFTEGSGTPVGEVAFVGVTLNRTGGFCPEESTWTAHYKLTNVVEGKTSFNQAWVTKS